MGVVDVITLPGGGAVQGSWDGLQVSQVAQIFLLSFPHPFFPLLCSYSHCLSCMIVCCVRLCTLNIFVAHFGVGVDV